MPEFAALFEVVRTYCGHSHNQTNEQYFSLIDCTADDVHVKDMLVVLVCLSAVFH